MLIPVCILGCGRSGTSILGELFQDTRAYTYLSEPPLEAVYQLKFKDPVAVKMPKPGSLPASPGLPFLWPDVKQVFPEDTLWIWQVRHPLDTICSLKVGIEQNWGHHPRPPDWKDWLDHSLLERCAHHWNYLNTVGYDQVRNAVTVNKFEDMINDPLETARKLLSATGMHTMDYQWQIQQWASRVQNTNNSLFIEAQCSMDYSRNDHQTRVDRWRENLSLEQARALKPLIEEGARRFSYDLL